MPFNVYAGFVKYRRFWMAAILLLCMITFVLCTGSKGDFSDRVLGWIRKPGTQVGSVDGSAIHREEIDKLKSQRNLANDFMKSYANRHLEIISEQMKAIRDNPDQFKLKDEQLKQEIMKLAQTRQNLAIRLKAKEFFPGGLQPDDLLTFKAWLAEADRLGVVLQPDDVNWLVLSDIYKMDMSRKFAIDAQGGQLQLRDESELQQRVIFKLRDDGNRNATNVLVGKALQDEYRVRMTQIAFSEFQPRVITEQAARGSPNWQRLPLSLGQLHDWFQEQRNEFDYTILPIPVKNFAKEIAEPDASTLQKFFDDNKNREFDPLTDVPGFKKPQQVKVQIVSANPDSKHFKSIAKTANALNAFPIASLTPQMPLATALRMAAGPVVLDGWLSELYEQRLPFDKQGNRINVSMYEINGPVSGDFPLAILGWLSSDEPMAAAAVVGAMLRPDGPFAAGPAAWSIAAKKHPHELKDAIEIEAKRRAPKYAALIASSLFGTHAAAESHLLSRERAYLPLPVVREKMMELAERRQIGDWVTANMRILKKRLEDAIVVGKQDQVERELRRYGPTKAGDATPRQYPDLGLEVVQTEAFHDRYSIADAPELKPLKEAFRESIMTINFSEGRDNALAKRRLVEDDFWKVFFDRTESFSLGESYIAKPWPPNVIPASQMQLEMGLREFGRFVPQSVLMDLQQHIDNRDPKAVKTLELFNSANRPFLFWKIAEKVAAPPESLAEVKDKVIEAWKLQRARETKALDKSAEIARALLKGNAEYHVMLQAEGKAIGAEPILLERQAHLVSDPMMRGYSAPKIDKRLFVNPCDEMMSQLLSLHDLKEPIKFDVEVKDKDGKKKEDAPGVAALNTLNDALHKEAISAKAGPDRFVQILTNKSRDTLYVVAIRTNRRAEPFQFQLSMMNPNDPFFDIAFDKLSESHQREMVRQVRKMHRVESNENLKTVDTSSD